MTGFIIGLIAGVAITSCIAINKISDLKLIIAHLKYKIQCMDER